MKKIFTILFTLILVPSLLKAQITLTTSDFPALGEGWYEYIDTTNQLPVGASGANQSWDYSNFIINDNSGVLFLSPSVTPTSWSSNFPNASLVSYNTTDTNAAYFRSNSNGFYIDGFYDGSAGAAGFNVIDFNPNRLIVPAPFTYNSTRTHRSRIQIFTVFNGTNVQFIQGTNHNFVADGYGTLTTPAGVFNNVLRTKELQYIDVSILVDLLGFGFYTLFQAEGPKDTSVIYSWFKNGPQALLFTLNEEVIDAVPTGFSRRASFYSTTPLSVNTSLNEKNTGVKVYPNPSSGSNFIQFFVEGAGREISIFDSSGRMIKKENIGGSQTVYFDTKLFESGMYLYNITSSEGKNVKSGKFVISE